MLRKRIASRFVKVLSGAAAATLLLGIGSAGALEIAPGGNQVTIGTADINQSFNVDWSTSAGAGNPQLTASSVWTILGFNSSSLTLKITLTNTTTDTATFKSAITGFGAGMTPNATGTFAASGQGSIFKNISPGKGPQQTFPGGFKNIDLCVSSAGCSGGSFQGGLHAGVTDIMTVILSAAFGTTPETALAFFPIKFQTSAGSFEPAGQVSTVPLPTTLPLLAVALAGLVMLGKKQCHRPDDRV